MLTSLVLFFAENSGGAFDWTGDQIRTIESTILVLLVGYGARMLYCLRDDVRNLHRDIRGDEKFPGLIDAVAGNTKRIDLIEKRNLKIDILDDVEHELHPGPDRRTGPRRVRDKMADTYEHPTEGDHR